MHATKLRTPVGALLTELRNTASAVVEPLLHVCGVVVDVRVCIVCVWCARGGVISGVGVQHDIVRGSLVPMTFKHGETPE